MFERQLWLVGMPGTTKFLDLARDPRLSLHTATIDTQVAEGDARLWGTAYDVSDRASHQRFADDLFDETGFDLRGSEFEHFYAVDIEGASAVEIVAGRMEVTIWHAGQPEKVVVKE